jgi:hypothetical protein
MLEWNPRLVSLVLGLLIVAAVFGLTLMGTRTGNYGW